MGKSGIKLTSIGLAALILLGGNNPFAVTEAYAAESDANEYSYNISYIKDESNVIINDPYTEVLMNSYRNADDSVVVDIPDFAHSQVCDYLKKGYDSEITVGDLRSLNRLFLVKYDDEEVDMSWLNYCSNLETLFITGDVVSHLDGVLALENVKTVSLSPDFFSVLDLSNCGFLKHCPKLEKLSLRGNYNPEQLYKFDNVRHLDVDVRDANAIDFERLAFLDELTLSGGAYDIAINLSTEEIAYLESHGVKIGFGQLDGVTMDDLKRVNDKLDGIVQELNVSPNATDEEKINAVLIYVLSHLEYDETVSNQLDTNQRDEIDHEAFYMGGELYAALEKDTQICGNFAALTSALLHRVGVDSYFLYSENHAWNLVEVDGEYYYYDSTWLDGQTTTIQHEERKEVEDGYSINFYFESLKSEDVIESGDPLLLEQLIWYKVKPSEYLANPDEYDHSHPESHSAQNFPISIVEVKTENNVVNNDTVSEDIANEDYINSETPQADKSFGEKLFDVTIGNKTFRITGAVLIGLMTALGTGLVIRKKKEEKRLREMRRRQQQRDMFSGYSSYSSYDPFDSNNHWRI